MKKGRKQVHHISASGDTIVGLSHLTDGRWRIIGTHIRFTEPDEAKAIKRFRVMTQSKTTKEEIDGVRRKEWLGEQVDAILSLKAQELYPKQIVGPGRKAVKSSDIKAQEEFMTEVKAAFVKYLTSISHWFSFDTITVTMIDGDPWISLYVAHKTR